MGTNESLQQIVLILSVANVLCPLVFGFFMWRASQVFVSKMQFDELRKVMVDSQMESREWRKAVDLEIIELLQRTSDRR